MNWLPFEADQLQLPFKHSDVRLKGNNKLALQILSADYSYYYYCLTTQ